MRSSCRERCRRHARSAGVLSSPWGRDASGAAQRRHRGSFTGKEGTGRELCPPAAGWRGRRGLRGTQRTGAGPPAASCAHTHRRCESRGGVSSREAWQLQRSGPQCRLEIALRIHCEGSLLQRFDEFCQPFLRRLLAEGDSDAREMRSVISCSRDMRSRGITGGFLLKNKNEVFVGKA